MSLLQFAIQQYHIALKDLCVSVTGGERIDGLFYQLLIELFGPVSWVIYMVISVLVNFDPLNYLISGGYVLTQIAMTLFAVSFDYRHKTREFMILIPRLVFTSMEGTILHIAIMGARLYGMITFHWRRMVW